MKLKQIVSHDPLLTSPLRLAHPRSRTQQNPNPRGSQRNDKTPVIIYGSFPDGITNRILIAIGEQAMNIIYIYMLIIWAREAETYPGAWASALMQPIYKGGGKDRPSSVSYRGIYLLNTVIKLFESLIEARPSKFTELNDTLNPSQQGSQIT